jgi:uncharacterized protein (TIGR02145 family)
MRISAQLHKRCIQKSTVIIFKFCICLFLMLFFSCSQSLKELNTFYTVPPPLKKGEVKTLFAYVEIEPSLDEIPIVIQNMNYSITKTLKYVDSKSKADLLVSINVGEVRSYTETVSADRLNPTAAQATAMVKTPWITPMTEKVTFIRPFTVSIFTSGTKIFSQGFDIDNQSITSDNLINRIQNVTWISNIIESLFMPSQMMLTFEAIKKAKCSPLFSEAFEDIQFSPDRALTIYNKIQEQDCKFYTLYSKAICNFELRKYRESGDLLLESLKYTSGDELSAQTIFRALNSILFKQDYLQSNLNPSVIYQKNSSTKTMIPSNSIIRGTMKDVDGNVYQTVKIGNQEWMAENLRVTKYNDGSQITLITEPAEWHKLKTEAYCYYNNDSTSFKNTYGVLYNGYAVNTGKLAPLGWHVPSDSEWNVLITYLGGDSIAGSALKESGTKHWNALDKINHFYGKFGQQTQSDATNYSGFSALPGGFRALDGSFLQIGEFGNWWSSLHRSSDSWAFNIFYDYANIYHNNKDSWTFGYSVRCIKNP